MKNKYIKSCPCYNCSMPDENTCQGCIFDNTLTWENHEKNHNGNAAMFESEIDNKIGGHKDEHYSLVYREGNFS